MTTIIYLHRGNPFFLHLSIEQAHKQNPDIPIILLGDETNKDVRFAQHFMLTDYMDRASELAKVYRHASPNGYDYELFCFQRWLIIWEFMQKNPSFEGRFAYFDSDTLLFDGVRDCLGLGENGTEEKPMPRLLLENNLCPAFSFFDHGTLGEICRVIEGFYTDPKLMQYWTDFVSKTEENKAVHGFSDMYALEYYCLHEHPGETRSIDLPTADEAGELACFDQNICLSDGFVMNDKGQKAFTWRNGKPYARLQSTGQDVRFRGIHFQGKSKFLMAPYTHTPIYRLKGHWVMDYIKYLLRRFTWITKLKKTLSFASN